MTWTKLSDDFTDDCWTLSDAAVRLHVDGLIWSNRKLLDNRIPVEDIVRISKAADAVTELTNLGWWTLEDDVFVIRHHAVYQRTREQVVALQERNQRNGRKGGRPAGRERAGVSNETPETQSDTQMGSQVETEMETQRDGTGQDGFLTHLPASQGETNYASKGKNTHAHASACLECQRRSVWDSGPCPEHRAAS